MRRDPICKMCGREAATVADHIKPLAQGGDWSLENGQGLCHGCHSIKTRRENSSGYGA